MTEKSIRVFSLNSEKFASLSKTEKDKWIEEFLDLSAEIGDI